MLRAAILQVATILPAQAVAAQAKSQRQRKKWDETLEKLEAYVKLDDKVEGVDTSDPKLKDYNDAWDSLQISIKAAKDTVQNLIDSGTEKEDAYYSGNTALGLTVTSSIERAYKALNDTNKKLAMSESGTSSGNNSTTGGNNGTTGGNASSLEGLWLFDESEGFYFKGNTLYIATGYDGKYYYLEEGKESISVSGNKIVYEDGEEMTFEIKGNTMTISYGRRISYS